MLRGVHPTTESQGKLIGGQCEAAAPAMMVRRWQSGRLGVSFTPEVAYRGPNVSKEGSSQTPERTTVLIADHLALLREGTRQILEASEGITVVAEAGDGEQAVGQVSELHPEVAVLDIALPRLNGLETTRRIKTCSPGTAVVVLTDSDDDVYVLALLEVGAAAYVKRTARGKDLVRCVLDVRAGEPVLGPALAARLLPRFIPSKRRGQVLADEDPLTSLEHELLLLAARGTPNRAIAAALGCGQLEVRAAFRDMFEKLGVASRTEAIMVGLRRVWLTAEHLLPP